MTKLYYMHTLDGEPAFFQKEQIVFAEKRDHWQDDYPVCVLRESVDQIRADQKKHCAFRARHGWDVGALDFVIVSLESAVIPWKPAPAKKATRRPPRSRT